MQFTRLNKDNVFLIKEFLDTAKISFCDISIGAKFMWRDEYVIDFCIDDGTLIMKEKGPDYDNVFYYPFGKNPEYGMRLIESYCRENFIPLEFCCIDEPTLNELKERYYDIYAYSDRDWDDYIYPAEQFKTYKGKKLSGQRNHVNKFTKLYPNYVFTTVTEKDADEINAFLDEYALGASLTADAREEVEMTREFVKNITALNQLAGALKVDGKIVGLSIGEIVGETLIVHVEKALTAYNGAYPTLAKAFANAFAGDGVRLINREEDCGDLGLRQSKTQYHPLEVKRKYAVKVNTLFDRIERGVKIATDRLTVEEILETDKDEYFRLYTDDELNKWWGYDYREDLDGKPTPDWFYNFQNALKNKKEEFSFAVKADGKMVGELVLHNFDYYGGVEMGFRFFKECQGRGYATEGGLALKNYVKNALKAITLKSRCFKQNNPSKNLIGRLGLRQVSESETHYFFQTEL